MPALAGKLKRDVGPQDPEGALDGTAPMPTASKLLSPVFRIGKHSSSLFCTLTGYDLRDLLLNNE
jgi:hypothetical protein